MPIHTIDQGWALETRTTGYALGLNPAGLLTHRYWGPQLPRADDYPPPADPAFWSFNNVGHLSREEFPGHENIKFVEPCLKVAFADGVRDVVLRYEAAELVAGELPELRVQLRDAHYPLRVTLFYRVHEAHDLIERWATLCNDGDEPLTIERIWSAQWHMPPGEGYLLTHLTGRHVDEFHLRRVPLPPGLHVLESRRLTTSHHHSPWFAVERGDASEAAGALWFGALAWSGNWKLVAETTDFGSTRVSLGVNDWDFAWRLGPGETFTAPGSLAGYSDGGFGAASRRLHDYVRERLLPHGEAPHRVLYNSWEATEFAVDEPSQCALAEVAAKMCRSICWAGSTRCWPTTTSPL